MYASSGREITKFTVIYGVYTIFLAGEAPNIRSKITVYIYDIIGRETTKYTVIHGVYIRYYCQGYHHTYGHIRCIFKILSAEKSPNIQSYTVYI